MVLLSVVQWLWLWFYQLGVDGGDREGRLLVSRCSDDSDFRSTGFQTIPPTTRWHTGPLDIWRKIRLYQSNLCQTHMWINYRCASTGSPLSFTVAEAKVLRYQLFVWLNCAVVVFGAPGSSVGAKEGVMVHTGSPKVLTGLWTGQSQRHFTILGLPLWRAQFSF